MMRAPLPIMFAGFLTLALGGIAVATPHGTSPKAKTDVPSSKSKTTKSTSSTTRKITKTTKAPAKRAVQQTFMVLQIDGDEIVPSSKTAIVKVTPKKCKA